MPPLVFRASLTDRELRFVARDAASAIIRREEHVRGSPDDLVGGVAEKMFRAAVPGCDAAVGLQHEDGVVAQLFEHTLDRHAGTTVGVDGRAMGMHGESVRRCDEDEPDALTLVDCLGSEQDVVSGKTPTPPDFPTPAREVS